MPIREFLLERRALLIAPFAFFGLVGVSSWRSPEKVEAGAEVDIADFDDQGRRLGVRRVARMVKTETEWKRQLGAQQFYVTRHGSTDTPYTGTYYEIHDAGIFRCVCCGTALFRSEDKYDSGTGWPSFSDVIAAENIATVRDVSMAMERVEVKCRLCRAHLGHVFQDGPPPTGLRYCMNESALRFVKRGS